MPIYWWVDYFVYKRYFWSTLIEYLGPELQRFAFQLCKLFLKAKVISITQTWSWKGWNGLLLYAAIAPQNGGTVAGNGEVDIYRWRSTAYYQILRDICERISSQLPWVNLLRNTILTPLLYTLHGFYHFINSIKSTNSIFFERNRCLSVFNWMRIWIWILLKKNCYFVCEWVAALGKL